MMNPPPVRPTDRPFFSFVANPGRERASKLRVSKQPSSERASRPLSSVRPSVRQAIIYPSAIGADDGGGGDGRHCCICLALLMHRPTDRPSVRPLLCHSSLALLLFSCLPFGRPPAIELDRCLPAFLPLPKQAGDRAHTAPPAEEAAAAATTATAQAAAAHLKGKTGKEPKAAGRRLFARVTHSRRRDGDLGRRRGLSTHHIAPDPRLFRPLSRVSVGFLLTLVGSFVRSSVRPCVLSSLLFFGS